MKLSRCSILLIDWAYNGSGLVLTDRVWDCPHHLNAVATPAAREQGPLLTRWPLKPELARMFHDNAVRSLPEQRAAEIAARTLALPDARSVEDLTGPADLGGGALRSRQLPLPDCVGQVGHPLRRFRADRLQGHAARVHALEQADSGAEQHG